MRVRWIGLAPALVLVLVLALVAGIVGYERGEHDRPTPTSFQAEPVPAVSPSYPVTPPKVVQDDAYPALEPGEPLHPVRLGQPPFQVRVPIPRGWVRSDSTAGEWRWYPAANKTSNIYFMRVRQVATLYQTVPVALEGRITALENAAEVHNLVIEKQRPDRFVCSYVAFEHRRVSFEAYLPRGEFAFLWIAVIGRESDRRGLRDLFDRIVAGAKTDLS
jgi:hypothetical protein